ncbi:hypothetical protein EDM80_04560 [bacterium]|nr:MAG: hypothetical protein EDM80_04560 [bacterium]
MGPRRAATILLMQLACGVAASGLLARAGGGDSFSGGGGSSGGADGDIGALIYLIVQLIRLLLWLWMEGGPVGKVLCVAILVALAWAGYRWWRQSQREKQRAMEGKVYRSARAPGRGLLDSGFGGIRERDPNFSRVLFLDFAHLIFTRLHESRGKGDGSIAPYLAPALREKLNRGHTTASRIVVGAAEIESVEVTAAEQRISIRFKANLLEQSAGEARRVLLEQRLLFARPHGIITRSPDQTLKLGCPNCGSPEEPRTDGKCPSCGTVTARGEAGWQVRALQTLRKQDALEPLISSGGVEEGTGTPTVVSPLLESQLRALKARDPAFNLKALTQRVQHMFMEIQRGWSEADTSRLRPYETDTLFDAHRYWIERFVEQGVRNVLEEVTIERIQLAKIEHDAWYDAATVRIYAHMRDWYRDRSGKVAGGNPEVTRRFSEYWTLIRRTEAAGRPSGDPDRCPSCGATLDRVNMAGICEYCGSKVISGNFDWVLSSITQDEEYAG